MPLRRFVHLGLVGRLVTLVVFISIVTGLVVTFFNVQYNLILIRKKLNEEAVSLEARLKASYVQPVWNFDYITLEEMLHSEFVNPLIKRLILKNDTGEFLIGFERTSNNEIIKVEQMLLTKKLENVTIIYKRKSGFDESIAQVFYEFDENYLYAQMWQTVLLQTFEFLFLTMALAIALGWMMVRRVIQPLEIIRLGLASIRGTLQPDFKFFSEQTKATAVAFPELKIMASELEDVFKDLGEKTYKLQENQQRLELVLSGASLGSWDWNLDTDLYSIDDHWSRILGLEKTELSYQSREWFVMVHPDDLLYTRKALNDHFEGKTPSYESEYRFRHKSGSWLWVLSRGKVNQRDANGKALRISGTHLDVTDKRKAQEELIKLNILQGAILEYAGYAIIAMNSSGVITTFNRAAEKMLGYSLNEVALKKSVLMFHDHDELEARRIEFSHELNREIENGFSVIVVKSLEGARNEHEWTYIRKDGTRFPVLLSVTTLRDPNGNLMGFLSVAADITEQKRNLEAISKQNIQLEMLGVHAREMAIKAQAANEAKSKFIANMSHEIRTPMNAIIGYTELLMETDLVDEQKTYISSIQSSGSLLLDLVNNILEVTKIEAGVLALKKREFSLLHILTEVTELLRPKAQKKGVELRTVLPENLCDRLLGDPLRLRQILINFIDNGVKFTEHGLVQLSVGPIEKLSDNQVKIYFEIKDSGIGIEANKLSNLFTRFNQLDDSITKRFGGSGLGLAISREIIRLMNGDIQVQSNLGQGTTFSFFLLFESAPEYQKTLVVEPQKITKKPKSLKILLAEDTEENQILILHYFKKLPYQIDIVANGVEALEKFEMNSYDLVLMDLQMPVMDGLTATKKIREIEKSKGRKAVPIIALTAYALDEQKEMCIASGCNLHIAKPVKKDYLLQVVAEQTDN